LIIGEPIPVIENEYGPTPPAGVANAVPSNTLGALVFTPTAVTVGDGDVVTVAVNVPVHPIPSVTVIVYTVPAHNDDATPAALTTPPGAIV
jgi:hypothetical protein